MLTSKTLIADATTTRAWDRLQLGCNLSVPQFYSRIAYLASPTCSDPSTKNEEGATMEQEKWARELEMMSSELNEGCIGEDLHCMLICGLNEREPEDKGEHITKDRADLLIRFAQILQGIGDDIWSPSVTARFEKGLDGLEVLLHQGDLADKQREAIKGASHG